jgi:PPK2 family polyphosphate:nucleotide phosphotransferase
MGKFDAYLVKPGLKFSIKDHDADSRAERGKNKEEDLEILNTLSTQINTLQDILYAQEKFKVLLVLQGMDASGKDGTVKHVFSECDPLGIRLASFKAPTSEELAHDYLWRVHEKVPKKGEITIFNRSHYEDVLIVKVHNWIDDKTCQQRYQHINDFEKMLADTGTVIIKCFLNISKDEQKERMYERLNDATKTWKFNPGDLDERDLWPSYMQAYEEAINATSTKHAPWYVSPANSKTNRNLLISRILLETLKEMDLAYPPVPKEYADIVVKD